jgi:hypothetical protein
MIRSAAAGNGSKAVTAIESLKARAAREKSPVLAPTSANDVHSGTNAAKTENVEPS